MLGLNGPDDVQIIHEQAAAHILIDVLARIGQVGQLGIRRPQEALTRLHRHTRGELALRIAEAAGAFNHGRNDRHAVHGKNQLARRRGDAGRFVARLELFRRRIGSRDTGAASAARHLVRAEAALHRQRRRQRFARASHLSHLAHPAHLPHPAAGPSSSTCATSCRSRAGRSTGRQVRIHFFGASEIRDAETELIFAVHRERVAAIHRAAQRIRQPDALIAAGQHIVVILRTAVQQPDDQPGLGRQRFAIHRKARDVLRRLHVLFHQQRRDRQHVAVVVEAVSRSHPPGTRRRAGRRRRADPGSCCCIQCGSVAAPSRVPD